MYYNFQKKTMNLLAIPHVLSLCALPGCCRRRPDCLCSLHAPPRRDRRRFPARLVPHTHSGVRAPACLPACLLPGTRGSIPPVLSPPAHLWAVMPPACLAPDHTWRGSAAAFSQAWMAEEGCAQFLVRLWASHARTWLRVAVEGDGAGFGASRGCCCSREQFLSFFCFALFFL